ncbi:hypothetical protein JTE90_011368 [Oedothorax gibbosus]|uniref:Uncharacterized protein n=1 Tax=Oedothorax gibbosus TaxID=931172 RepID=A0AAV6VME4_9ARAC|nr:hypothetical protein JTE90_011368 [Oedothorax gibbosus]
MYKQTYTIVYSRLKHKSTHPPQQQPKNYTWQHATNKKYPLPSPPSDPNILSPLPRDRSPSRSSQKTKIRRQERTKKNRKSRTSPGMR